MEIVMLWFRKLFLPLLLAALLLLGLLFSSGCQDKDNAGPATGAGRQSTKPVGDSKKKREIEQHTLLTLPDSAENIDVYNIGFFVDWTYVRFDVPEEDFLLFVNKNPRCPDLSDLEGNGKLLNTMIVVSDDYNLPWFELANLMNPVCAEEKTWIPQNDGSFVCITISLCAEAKPDNIHEIYIVHSAEAFSSRPIEPDPNFPGLFFPGVIGNGGMVQPAYRDKPAP